MAVLANCAPEICAARAQPRRRQTFPASFHQTGARKDIASARRSSRHCPAPSVSCRTAGRGLLRLTYADVDLDAGLLHIRHSKFDKSRVVPIAPDLVQQLLHCRTLAAKHFGSCLPPKPFFPSPRGGGRYSINALREAFHQTLKTAGIERTRGNRYIRLHDLRHSFAALRLLLWCEQNVDLDAKLPLLATYLGHVGLASSQRYLQLTQDLMGEITRRHQARFGYLINEGRL